MNDLERATVNELAALYRKNRGWSDLADCGALWRHVIDSMSTYSLPTSPSRRSFVLKLLIDRAVEYAIANQKRVGITRDQVVNCRMARWLIGAVENPGNTQEDRQNNVHRELGASNSTIRRRANQSDECFQDLFHMIDAVLNDASARDSFVRAANLNSVDPSMSVADQSSKPSEGSATDRGVPDTSVALLQRLSTRLATDLDIASTAQADGQHYRLSDGLHVRRVQQATVLNALRSDRYEIPIVVSGGAGDGKSSLLWSLHREMSSSGTFMPFLLESLWLVSLGNRAPQLNDETLKHAASAAQSGAKVPVFLIDTVDLLLHDLEARTKVLDVCDLLTDAGARVVMATRPEEAQALSPAFFKTIKLALYDEERELPDAIERHVSIFCPSMTPRTKEDLVAAITGAVSDGRPVREIVRSPLKLRLLFDLYGGVFPNFNELDVALLYKEYWKRRVITDQRSEAVPATGDDLSSVAKQMAIALLAAGRPSLAETRLKDATDVVRNGWTDASKNSAGVHDGITVLARRGVVVRTLLPREAVIQYFHQTMFEYAAALGLLARDRGAALRFLSEHVRNNSDDLFVGAVLEQALILGIEGVATSEDAIGVLRAIAHGQVPSLQRIALSVLAYYPQLEDIADYLISTVDSAALRRYVAIVPTVQDVNVSRQVDVLSRVWKQDPYARESVLDALARFGAREPNVVMSKLKELDLVNSYAFAKQSDDARRIDVVSRTIVSVGSADRRWTAEQILTFIKTMIKKKHRGTVLYILDLLAQHWDQVGSAELAYEVELQVLRAQNAHNAAATKMRDGLGKVLAHVWISPARQGANDWWKLLNAAGEILSSDHRDVHANIKLATIGYVLATDGFPEDRANESFDRLLMTTNWGCLALANSLFPTVLKSKSSTSATIRKRIVGLLNGLPAPGNKAKEGPPRWAHAARHALRDARVSPYSLAQWLQSVPDADHVDAWLADDRLVALLVQASAGDHPIATLALDRVAQDVDVLSASGKTLVSYDLWQIAEVRPQWVSILVDLALSLAQAAPLSEVVIDPSDAVIGELYHKRRELINLIDILMTGSGRQQRDGASLWVRLYVVGVVPSPNLEAATRFLDKLTESAAIQNVLRLATEAALRKDLPIAGVLLLLEGRFRIEEQMSRLAHDDDVAVAARLYWIRICARAGSLSDMNVEQLIRVACASPTDSGVLSEVGYLIGRLAAKRRSSDAERVLLKVADSVDVAGLTAKQENALANSLRGSMRAIFRHADQLSIMRLVRQAPNLPRYFARIMVSAAAQERFGDVRTVLNELLSHQLPHGVEQQIHDDIKARSRIAAVAEIPRLLLPLDGE